MKLYTVRVVAPGVDEVFEKAIRVFAPNEYMASVNAYMYAVESNVCEPQVLSVKEYLPSQLALVENVEKEPSNASERILPFNSGRLPDRGDED